MIRRERVTVIDALDRLQQNPIARNGYVLEDYFPTSFEAALMDGESVIVEHRYSEEGRTWARGWDTKEAAALVVAHALVAL